MGTGIDVFVKEAEELKKNIAVLLDLIIQNSPSNITNLGIQIQSSKKWTWTYLGNKIGIFEEDKLLISQSQGSTTWPLIKRCLC